MARQPQEPERFAAEVRFVLNNKTMVSFPLEVNFQGSNKTNAIMNISGLVIPEEGELLVRAFRDGRKLGEWPIIVERLTIPATQPQAVQTTPPN